ncbi:MAG: hypothetical protein Q4E32_01430 [Bacteroidales bacterium]|nr:hypothetical protein [Bacteroidales bacterium]
MEEKRKWQNFKSGAGMWFLYLAIYLAIAFIVWLFIRPSFNRWRMESRLNPIQIEYYRDGGADSEWFGEGYDYYVNVGFRGKNYRVNVSETVYTGTSTPVFYYDTDNDVIFEKGTGHTKVTIFFLTFGIVFIWLFIWIPISSAIKARRQKKWKALEQQFGVTPIDNP